MLEGRQLAVTAARAAAKKKAIDVQILDLKGIFPVADYFVICSARNVPQIAAIAQGIEEDLAREGQDFCRIQGTPESEWVLMDYGDVIVHVFSEQMRRFYNLEHLWGDAKVITEDFQS